jgi:acyl-CoA dehydrogenase
VVGWLMYIMFAYQDSSNLADLFFFLQNTKNQSIIMLSRHVSPQSSLVRRSVVAQQTRGILGISAALDRKLYRAAKSVMPTISKTEQIALACGTIGFDRDIFTGSPSLKKLVDTYQPVLSAEEQAFLTDKVDHLCSLISDHEVVTNRDFNKATWDYMRSEGFFALKIPKEWGGLQFSTHAVSQILAKLATHCFDANATVAVPNSLGPGELLARYGTLEQKEYFLPRLADGTLIPCFGLTGPHSGSDATSLIGSECIVEERKGELGVRATFQKRYITLAPVAGVVGLGLNLKDPNNLLKGKGESGFTVALLERDHPGLRMGPRHNPLNAAFMNGTVEGEDVWIPMSLILGGQERCGFGWHMFVECLAEGRGVSLPAGSVGAGRAVVSGVGAYTRIRKQFRVPIAEFGGIQEGKSLYLFCRLLIRL